MKKNEHEDTLLKFCYREFPSVFQNKFTSKQRELLNLVEDTLREGGNTFKVMERGSGKSCILFAALLFAIVELRKKKCVLLTRHSEAAKSAVDFIRAMVKEKQGKAYFRKLVEGESYDVSSIRHEIKSIRNGFYKTDKPDVLLIDDVRNCDTAVKALKEHEKMLFIYNLPLVQKPEVIIEVESTEFRGKMPLVGRTRPIKPR
jgi:hypothetical protein